MTDDELRGWISDDRRHGVHINAGTLSDLAAEVLRLRAKEAAAVKLAEAVRKECRTFNGVSPGLAHALAAWEAAQ